MNPQAAKAGPYDIVDVVHRGPRWVVYLATQGDSDQPVVVKMASEAVPLDAEATPGAATRLLHRHIVRVLDAGHDNGFPYLVMERLQGRTLRDLIADTTYGADLPTRVDLIAQLCVGLHHAHEQQIVHGNLRPDNVFVTDDGVTKILNFGGTASANDHTMVSDNSLAGSFEYMSPEQIIGREAVDGRSDVFSAGLLLYEFVSGRRPFQGASTPATLARILRDDPPPLEGLDRLNTIVRRALEKDPEKRYATAQEFAYALWMMDLPGAVEEEDAADSEIVYADAQSATAEAEADEPPAAAGLSQLLSDRRTLTYLAIGASVIVIAAIAAISC